MTSSFFLVLPSNSELNNTPSKFKIQLGKALDFNSNWQVALYSISFPVSYVTIGRNNDDYVLVKIKDRWIKYDIFAASPSTPRELEVILNKQLILTDRKRRSDEEIDIHLKRSKRDVTPEKDDEDTDVLPESDISKDKLPEKESDKDKTLAKDNEKDTEPEKDDTSVSDKAETLKDKNDVIQTNKSDETDKVESSNDKDAATDVVQSDETEKIPEKEDTTDTQPEKDTNIDTQPEKDTSDQEETASDKNDGKQMVQPATIPVVESQLSQPPKAVVSDPAQLPEVPQTLPPSAKIVIPTLPEFAKGATLPSYDEIKSRGELGAPPKLTLPAIDVLKNELSKGSDTLSGVQIEHKSLDYVKSVLPPSFDSDKQLLSNYIRHGELAAYPVELSGGLNQFFVYSDICENVIVGNTLSALLQVVPVQAKSGEITEKVFNPLLFTKVRSRHISEISIELRDLTVSRRIMRVVFNPSSVQFTDIFTNDQIGYGSFYAGYPLQRGLGWSDLLKTAWRFFLPMAKEIGKEGLTAGANVLTDLSQGNNFKKTLTKQGAKTAKSLLMKASNEIPQIGNGRKKRRKAVSLKKSDIIGKVVLNKSKKKRIDAFGPY
uniref:Uncharacterized protein n=1 Tax=Panagrolaimus sp. ES5 TaxID=591445 RepID=A0AC34EZS3_9BILA